MATHVTAHVEHVGKWWAIDVDGVDGAYTQARNLAEVPEMAADVVGLILGIDASDVDVTVKIEMPATVREHLRTADELRRTAAHAQAAAAQESRAAARELHDAGLGLRDVGQVLGISFQRAHQLISADH